MIFSFFIDLKNQVCINESKKTKTNNKLQNAKNQSFIFKKQKL